MADEQEFFTTSEVRQVIRAPGNKIIHPNDFMTLRKQAIT
jgi:hypothetical protein